MSLIRLSFLAANFLLLPFTWATPSVEILQSCKNSEPANNSISMTRLDQAVVMDDAGVGCEDKFELTYNNQKYGSVTCNNEAYLIINDNKIKLNTAVNLSVNPSVKPDTPLLITSRFWKIDKGNDSYLCVSSALGQAGGGAGSLQYYIVENAFNNSVPVSLYFYFFDRESMSLTSIN